MRVPWSYTLLIATAISLPFNEVATPCREKRCSYNDLVIREADAAIIPIIPFPKPLVPAIIPVPVVPKPFIPKPITPKPVDPAPLPPKPVAPERPNTGLGSQCKRAPGDPCPNIAPFEDANLELVRAKGLEAQTRLLEVQQTSPLPQDVARPDVSVRYDRLVDDKTDSPIPSDEVGFLGHSGVQVPFNTDKIWITSVTRNKYGLNPKLDNNILETYTSPNDRGVVIADSRNKENDMLPATDKLPWSDMAMYDIKTSFREAGFAADELRYMIRSSIQGGPSAIKTQEYIEGAIMRTAGDRTQVNTFRGDLNAPGINTNEIAAYQLLAGSDHVHRVLLMLKDYPTTMRNVRIESLSVTTPATRDATDEYNIIIKFAKTNNS